jgi:hypothetical protein
MLKSTKIEICNFNPPRDGLSILHEHSKNGEGEDVGSTNHEPLLKQQASERARSDAPSAGVTTTNDLRRNRVQQSVQPTSLDTPEREGPLSHKRSKNLTVR